MKKLNNFKWFSLGIAACLLFSLAIIPTVASVAKKTATLEYSNIKVTLDGKAITPTDASGKAVEPFIMDGTTYLPVRGIANALNLGVDWDAATQTVKLTSGTTTKPAETPPAGNNSSTTSSASFGDKIVFDGLEITFGTTVRWGKVDNRYSENHNAVVAGVPITVKNVSDATNRLNRFYLTMFGPKGTELDNVAYYFDDSHIEIGDLRAGASKSGYFYFLYDGDGTYVIEFDNYDQELEASFDIKK